MYERSQRRRHLYNVSSLPLRIHIPLIRLVVSTCLFLSMVLLIVRHLPGQQTCSTFTLELSTLLQNMTMSSLSTFSYLPILLCSLKFELSAMSGTRSLLLPMRPQPCRSSKRPLVTSKHTCKWRGVRIGHSLLTILTIHSKSKNLNILVGYAAIDADRSWLDPLANYLSCESDEESLDIFGLNN